LSVVGKKEVFISVVVVIADAHSTSPASRIQQTSFRRDVGEGAIAIVVVEVVAGAGRNTLQCAPTEDEDVHPAIVVVIKERAARSVDLNDVGIVRVVAIEHRLLKAGIGGDIHKM